MESGEKPGDYSGDDAKRICKQVFQFLQKKLEIEIMKYNGSLLLHAYKEVELVEAQRIRNRFQVSVDASKYTEYDIVQKNREMKRQIAQAANASKYIIETNLKVGKEILGEKNVEATIDNFKRFFPGFPRRPECGEIDLLVVNKDIKVVFVLDAKNLNRKLRPYGIRQEMRTFFEGKKSLLSKLSKKKKFVEENLKEILKYFSINDTRRWKVRKAFIVNFNYPSAYFTEEKVDFVLIKNLSSYLKGIEKCD